MELCRGGFLLVMDEGFRSLLRMKVLRIRIEMVGEIDGKSYEDFGSYREAADVRGRGSKRNDEI